MKNRIEYEPFRTITMMTLPYVIICTLPNWLGLVDIQPKYQTFRYFLDGSIFGLFIGCIGCSLYAMIHNARIENKG